MSEIDFLLGETVVEVQDDARVVFQAASGPEPRLYADVGACDVIDADKSPLSMSALAGRAVTGVSTSDGTLRLEFGDGVTLRCDPNPDYEAWQVVGGDPQYLVVCLPGGELAVWDSRQGR